MDAENALLESLRPVLANEIPTRDLDKVVLQKVVRDRSCIYFVGFHGPTFVRRWVVKQPAVAFRQADLEPPLPAAALFEAHERLYEHLQRLDGSILAPRPVGVMPDVNAYVMEYVTGTLVSSHIAVRSVRTPHRLLHGMAEAARVLQTVHTLELAQPEIVQLADLENEARTTAAQLIRGARLRVPAGGFFSGSSTSRSATASTVVLHGDFAPENVIVGDTGTYCLDADLAEKGAAEKDVVRYLVMLYQEKFFLVGADVPPVQDLRRRAAAAFLSAYYGDHPWPESLQPLMVVGLAARYVRRQMGGVPKSSRMPARRALERRARKVLERRHFQKLLDEVSSQDYFQRLQDAGR